jgi:DNA-binding transcriptional MocR family regulator
MSSSVQALMADLRARVATMKQGDRLPSTREIVAGYHVSPVTVSRALAHLSAEGVVRTKPGNGTFVADRRSAPEGKPLDTGWQTIALGDRAIDAGALQTYLESTPAGALPLAGGYLHSSLMPVSALTMAGQRAVRRPDVWERPPPSGLPALRTWFSSQLGAGASAEDVTITNGGQSAISAAFRALLPAGSTLLVEAPTYPGALAIARAAGLSVAPVPLDQDGLRSDLLEEAFRITGAKVLYVQPSHQNPTGAVMPTGRRAEILSVAREAGAFVIEDDWSRWLGFEGTSPAPMFSMDTDGRVIYVVSLTKPVAPSLRVGALIARGPVADRLRAIRMVDDLFVNRLAQETAVELVSGAGWGRHFANLARALRDRRGILAESLARYAPALTVARLPRGGMHLWVGLPDDLTETGIADACRTRGVLVSAGRAFFATEPQAAHLRLSFGGAANGDDLREAAERIGRAVASQEG